MGLWDKDSPVWKTVQTIFAVLGIAILVWHVEHSGVGSPDVDSVVGSGGLVVGVKLLWQSLKETV